VRPALGRAEFAFGADFLEIFADDFEIGVGEMFDLNHFVCARPEGMNNFVEL